MYFGHKCRLGCRFWTALFFLVVLMSFAVSVQAATRESSHKEDENQLVVLFHDEQQVSRAYQMEMLRETKRALPQDILSHISWMPFQDGSLYEGHGKMVTITFTGNCADINQRSKVTPGPLGWVLSIDGEIQPFIHVSCERIVDTVASLLRSQPRATERQLLARATGRVIAHEILHIVQQSPEHAHHGVQKPALAAEDLVEESIR